MLPFLLGLFLVLGISVGTWAMVRDSTKRTRLPMTPRRWIELFFGILIPSLLAVPVLVSFIGLVMIVHMDPKVLMLVAGVDLMFALGIMAIISLWLLILFGPDQINRWMKAIFFLGLLEGICLATYLFAALMRGLEIYGLLIWLSLLGPVVVGLRYLPQLRRGTKN